MYYLLRGGKHIHTLENKNFLLTNLKMRRRNFDLQKPERQILIVLQDSASSQLGNGKGSSNPRGKKGETFKNGGPMTQGRDKKSLKLCK